MGEGYRICLHGPFQAAGPDGPVEFQARSAAALVAYCSLRRGPVPRSEAASELWPDADPEVARTNLRTALHRVKKAAPDLLASEGEFLMLQGCTSDIDEADQRHRQFLLAPNDPSAIGALADEWEIRKRPLLDGWTDEWAELARLAADYAAQDVARELARAAEATDDDRLALATWTEVHTRMPSELEAIKNVLRLEAELNGRTKALAKAEQIERTLQTDAPPQLRNLLASLRTGVLEAVPKPELLRTRSEILLLARMFESNLKENREEALTLLLTECRKEGARHPKTAFSLVQLALSETTGASEVRVRLAMLASSLGSWVGEYHSAHHWADFAREHLPKTSAEYVEMLGNHGFMYLEQRQHTLAESCLREALAICDTHGFIRESLSTRVRLAGVLLHTMRFEEASAMYEETLKDGEAHQVPNLPAVRAATSYNTCLVRCMTGDWRQAEELGQTCMDSSHDLPVYQWLAVSPHGLSKYRMGDVQGGIRAVTAGVSSTAREKLPRYNQIALDFAAMVLALEGRLEVAKDVIEASTLYRAAIGHKRSDAETVLLEANSGLKVGVGPPSSGNSLAQQSPTALNGWVCDALSDLI